MYGRLHAVCIIIALPSALLAAAFVLIGQVARTRGLFALFGVVGASAWMLYRADGVVR